MASAPRPKLVAAWEWVTDRFLHGRSWWIADDLKQPVRCFRPALTKSGDDITGGAMSAKAYTELRRRLRNRSAALSLGVFFGWFMIAYAAYRAIEAVISILRTGFQMSDVIEAAITLAIGAAGFVTLRGLGNDPDDIARELKAQLRCASCAFDLRECIPNDGSLTRCPECSARWRIVPPKPQAGVEE